MLPLAFKLEGKPVLVIGAGRVAVAKARLLVEAGALVSIIARERLAPIPDGVVRVELRAYRRGDLAGNWLVVSATGDPVADDAIAAEAGERGIWLNVVDDASRSDVHFTAVHRDGDLVVSVSTGGASPALAQFVRAAVRDALPADLGRIANQLRRDRAVVRSSGGSTETIDWQARIGALLARDDDGLARPRGSSTA